MEKLTKNISTKPIIKMVQPTNGEIKMIDKEIGTIKLNFAYSIRPIYYFSRVFGLMPFSIVSDVDGYHTWFVVFGFDYYNRDVDNLFL